MPALDDLAGSLAPVLAAYHAELDREIAAARGIETALNVMSHSHDNSLDDTAIEIHDRTLSIFHDLHDLHRAINKLQAKSIDLAKLLEDISGLMVDKL